jgi:hypothetical protein
MAFEATSVHAFLNEIFQTKRIKDVIQEWSADPEELLKIIEKEVTAMGISMVQPASYYKFMTDQVVFLLRNSPQVRQLLTKLASEAKKRDQNKRR